jgi:hypothetical protein
MLQHSSEVAGSNTAPSVRFGVMDDLAYSNIVGDDSTLVTVNFPDLNGI